MLNPSKNKIYGNYKVLSPNNILMFRCNSKKINWYLNKNLAERIDDISIRLKFNPNGLGNHNQYGIDEMENICVVCGTRHNLNRHHVVPICYRKFFPTEKKNHKFHDILSICLECHESYEKIATQFKNELSIKYNAPLNGIQCDNFPLIKMKNIVNCILHNDKIPKYRIKEMKNEVKEYFTWKRISKKRLQNVLNIEINNVTKTHGEMVISKIDDIDMFAKQWRKHFVENMKCGFLPKKWSINNE